jgi:hypothetical protein
MVLAHPIRIAEPTTQSENLQGGSWGPPFLIGNSVSGNKDEKRRND